MDADFNTGNLNNLHIRPTQNLSNPHQIERIITFTIDGIRSDFRVHLKIC